MEETILQSLEGQKVVSVRQLESGGFALLFEDGVVLSVLDIGDAPVVFTTGSGWATYWDTLV